MMEHVSILAIAIPLLAAFATPLIGRLNKKIRNIWAIISLGTSLSLIILTFNEVIKNGIITYTLGASSPGQTVPTGWAVPVRIVLEIDGMGAFAALGMGITTFLAAIYSWSYFDEKETGLNRFYTLLLLLGAGGTGLAFTGDLFNLFVWLEVSSISATGLVAFWSYKGTPNEAGFKFILISAIGSLMVLMAVGIFYGQYDALNIAMIAQRMMDTGFTSLDKIGLVLLVGAFGMKCGAVPMHMWIPDAYSESPAPISMVMVTTSQLSLYGLFRISFSLFGLNLQGEILGWVIVIFGLLTMFVGVTMALIQKKVKRLMAYHAISQTGYMLLGVGVGLIALKSGELGSYGLKAMQGGIFHIINHAMYKGLLFLTAGAIIYKTGTKNLNKIGGLAREMPVTSIAFVIGAASIAGLPPFNGFASKILIYESVYKVNPFLTAVAMVVSVLTLASFVKIFQSAFLGPEIPEYKGIGEVPASMKISMIALSVLVILFGIFPDLIVNTIVEPAANALINQLDYIGGVL